MNAADTQSLASKTVILNLTLGKPGNRKKVKRSAVNVTTKSVEPESPEEQEESDGPDQKMLHVSKDLLDSPELEAISKYYGEIRRYVGAVALPTRTLKAGMYMLSVSSVAEVDTQLEKYQANLGPLKQAFADVYPAKVEEAFVRLGELADPMDYPPIEKILDAFKVDYQYLTFEAPQQLKGTLSQGIIKREEQKIQMQMADYGQQIELALAQSFKGIVDHLMIALKPEDGKKKKVTDATVEKFNTFFQNFNAKNVTQDGELAKLISQASELVNGATPAEINGDYKIKELIASRMDAVKMELDSLVVRRGGRRIILKAAPVAVTPEPVQEESHAA